MSEIVAVIFDWAGTLVDYGSRAPMGAFVETFAEFGVEITIEEARGPMGMAKRPHIAALCALPRVRAAWATRHGRRPRRPTSTRFTMCSCRRTSPSPPTTPTLFPAPPRCWRR